MSGVRRGNIFYIEKSNFQVGSEQADGRPAIIVSNDENNRYSQTVEVVYLTTQPKNDLPTHIEIRSARKPSTALCEQICTVAVERIGDYIGTCTDREMEALDIALAISLGIDLVPCEVEEPDTEPEPEEKQLDSGQVAKALATSVEKLIRAETERDVYKQLYEKLLEKSISD